MYLFLSLITNFSNQFSNLSSDYIGLFINYSAFIVFFINSILALFLIFITFLLGKKLQNIFFSNKKTIDYDFLISIALGFVFIGSSIAILGFLSILTSSTLYIFLFLIILYSVFPISQTNNELKELLNSLKIAYLDLSKNKVVYLGVILFLLVALINLINPETREDQYHVDLPRTYLREHSIMIPPKEDLHVSGSPLLTEMYYTLGIFITKTPEIARYIHFFFYFLVLLTLLNFSKLKGYKFSVYAPLLFVTAPVVIHETSSAYVDFQWLFFFLLTILIFISNKKHTGKSMLIMGILSGGMLATKLWTIVFIPILMFYLYISLPKDRYKNTLIFVLGVLSISLIWFTRAYLLTGDAFYPAFASASILPGSDIDYNLAKYLAWNTSAINPLQNLNVFSPFLFIGIPLLFYKFKENFQVLLKVDILKLLFLFVSLYLVINYPYGRYLIGLYVLYIFAASLGISTMINKIARTKYVLYAITFILFLYYFTNSMLILPYTFGIADKNKYLSRILIRDNSSYFDFGKKFDKYITEKDRVAMYNFHGYYYSTFNYIDVNFIVNKNNKSLMVLKNKGVTKLLIRGGDINWLCERLKLNDCSRDKYKLQSSYLEFPYYYLYSIK